MPCNKAADSGLRNLSHWDPEYAKIFLWALEEFKEDKAKEAYKNM